MKVVPKFSILDKLDNLIFESGGHNSISYIELTQYEYDRFIIENDDDLANPLSKNDSYQGIPIKIKQET